MADRVVLSTVITLATAPAGGPIYDLTDLATVKAELGGTNGATDASFRSFISRSSAAAAGYCNRVFAQETVKDEFWAARECLIPGKSEPLQLSRFPVIGSPTVIENAVSLVETSDFRTSAKAG